MTDGSGPSWDKTSKVISVIVGVIGILAFFGITKWSDIKPSQPSTTARSSGTTAPPRPVAGGNDSPPQQPYRPTTTTERRPPPASAGDCIAIDSDGDFLGLGNCDGSAGTYLVKSATYQGECADPGTPSITVHGYLLCLRLHLVEDRCYVIPEGRGWVTGAPACRAPGTVAVVDVVRGATTGAECTRKYQWNRWYAVNDPQVVYCVMVF
ncbi:hypothetical protein [Saccharothrix obliqua]|uniref:hypothetical protein n=1 Tax=Saccharothrix obliqua TaxID=2861747 RepID=UPI001C60684C|nr:hypothetical protein [Saccharothrix obliqua]MBW4722301.1 hypothetical protein [Saccharothrix obliqua]